MWRVTGQLFCPVSDCLPGILKNPQLEVNPLTYTNTCTYTHTTHTRTVHACMHAHTHTTRKHRTHTHTHTHHTCTHTPHTHTVQSTSIPLGYSVWRRETVHTCASQQFTACSTGCAVGHPNFLLHASGMESAVLPWGTLLS